MGKRYIMFPALLVIYAIIMAVLTFPKYQESGQWQEYLLVLGGSLLIAVLLFFVLKRKQKIRDKFSDKN